MKKTLALLLAALMLLSVSLVACNANGDGENTTAAPADSSNAPTGNTEAPETEAPKPAFDSALDLYTKIWAAFGDDNKFPSGGGSMGNDTMDGPGAYLFADVYETIKNGDAETEALVISGEDLKNTFTYMTHLTDELFAMIDSTDVATLLHMMNTNTFASAAVKLKDSSKAAEFAEAYKTAIQGQRWMCGFPDKVVVISIGDYLVFAFGHEGNIDNLAKAAAAVEGSAKVLVDAPAMVE